MADLSAKNSIEKRESLSQEQEKRESQSSVQLDSGISGVREGLENADVMTTGEVSEDTREDKQVFAGGMSSGTAQTTQSALAKQVKIPSVEVMRKQVAVEIRKEIKVLEKQAKKMMRNPSQFSPFTLNGMVSKIRELKEILGRLAYDTVENIKGWWMKYVKGNTI